MTDDAKPLDYIDAMEEHEAWGIDFHQPTLDWGIEHNISPLSDDQQSRVHLICGDVLEVETPKVIESGPRALTLITDPYAAAYCRRAAFESVLDHIRREVNEHDD